MKIQLWMRTAHNLSPRVLNGMLAFRRSSCSLDTSVVFMRATGISMTYLFMIRLPGASWCCVRKFPNNLTLCCDAVTVTGCVLVNAYSSTMWIFLT